MKHSPLEIIKIFLTVIGLPLVTKQWGWFSVTIPGPNDDLLQWVGQINIAYPVTFTTNNIHVSLHHMGGISWNVLYTAGSNLDKIYGYISLMRIWGNYFAGTRAVENPRAISYFSIGF